jgi:hypothetical protein
MARKKKRKARKAPKVRNWIAVARKACRGKQHQERD